MDWARIVTSLPKGVDPDRPGLNNESSHSPDAPRFHAVVVELADTHV